MVVKRENLDEDTVWDFVKDYYSKLGDKAMYKLADEIDKLLQEKNMKIDKRSKECVYITINGWVYYIDDSTGEQILQKWKEKK